MIGEIKKNATDVNIRTLSLYVSVTHTTTIASAFNLFILTTYRVR